jgi:hypothetical protein
MREQSRCQESGLPDDWRGGLKTSSQVISGPSRYEQVRTVRDLVDHVACNDFGMAIPLDAGPSSSVTSERIQKEYSEIPIRRGGRGSHRTLMVVMIALGSESGHGRLMPVEAV